jgi:predicted nucleic acid-binding protein
MPERWVVNASPLIFLAKINHVHLLGALADLVVVPQAVLVEVNAGPADDPARLLLANPPFPVVNVVPSPLILAWDLGDGETAVLSYAAAHAGWKAVIDDGAARRCAHALAIPLLGTLAIILRAQQAGLIAAAVPLLKALRAEGIRLDDNVIREALRAVSGESWD